jgi:hypothetical protein
VALATGIIGLFPGMQLAWIFTGLSGLAALALVGLVAYAKELESEQARRRSRHEALPGLPQDEDLAGAGYPGAWDDDDFELPRAVAR